MEDLTGIACSTEPVQAAGDMLMPWEILARFFKGMLKFLGIMDIVKNTKFLTVTVETLDDIQVENLQKACRSLGFADDQFSLLDYEESFYYYVLTQKVETWNRSVGWYSFDQDRVTFASL